MVCADQLCKTRLGAEDDVVRQQRCARLVADQPAGRPDGVSQPPRLTLLDVGDVDLVGDGVDVGQDAEEVFPPALAKVMLELQRSVEMVDDGALATACDHDHLLDTAGDCFLHAVLDRRLVDQRQHLFRLRFGGGQESGAEPGSGDDRLADGECRHARQSNAWTASTASSPESKAGWSGS